MVTIPQTGALLDESGACSDGGYRIESSVGRMKALGNTGQVVLASFGLVLLANSSLAVIFASTSSTTYNTTAPAGGLTNSGWQYEGQWGGFLGTPIAPTFFLAAKHVGGATGEVFVLNGYTYHTVAFSDCPNCDLRVWKVAETFPAYAPLYSASNEVGQLCVVFGRGTQRGDAVIVDSQLKGWKWGISDGVKRWGENIISSVYPSQTVGELLQAYFDRDGVTNECHLSVGDSSGGMFIQDGPTWKLAGVHYTVDGPFSLDATTNTQFNGAIMDSGGLWFAIPNGWAGYVDDPTDYPSSFYSTRISAHVNWINSVINFEPGKDLRIAALRVVRANCRVSLLTGSNRLYRVEHCSDLATGIWTTVTNNLVGNGGTVTVTDPGAAKQPKQFYRAILLQ